MVDQHDPARVGARPATASRRDAAGRFVAAGGGPRPRPARVAVRSNKNAAPRKAWQAPFLAKLAETSNITVSAEFAGIDTGTVYKERQKNAAFYAAWRGAVLEGYAALEMETLGRLRAGELRTDERKYDIANALRLLKAHAELVAEERARREDLDEEEVLDSIDRMIDSMRERAAANAALLAEDE